MTRRGEAETHEQHSFRGLFYNEHDRFEAFCRFAPCSDSVPLLWNSSLVIPDFLSFYSILPPVSSLSKGGICQALGVKWLWSRGQLFGDVSGYRHFSPSMWRFSCQRRGEGPRLRWPRSTRSLCIPKASTPAHAALMADCISPVPPGARVEHPSGTLILSWPCCSSQRFLKVELPPYCIL